MSKVAPVEKAAELVPDGAVVAVNSSSGLCCPDAVLKGIGDRFGRSGSPKGLTVVSPIAAGDMFGTKGVDHLARPGLLSRVIGGSYPSGPSSAEPPLVWQMISRNEIAAYNVPSGVVFDMLREAAAKRPGVLTKVGMETFADPDLDGCAMNEAARRSPVVRRVRFEDDDWLFFPAVAPDISVIRATTADESGNLTFEHEGAYLGAMELALAARNCRGKVIAQVKRVAGDGSLQAKDVHVPGILVDAVVEAPEQLQTTATEHDPAISGEVLRPEGSFGLVEFSASKVIARRVAQELQRGWAVNVGFGISANVPRILLEEGAHDQVTWMIEQGAVGGIPLLGFKFGCSANAQAFVTSPHQFSYFQAGGFDAALLSFLEVDEEGSVNVSQLPAVPHRTAGLGGFVDITARARKIVFSGNFNVGAKMELSEGRLKIVREGRIPKFVKRLDHVSFSGSRASRQGQDAMYVTERCVIRLLDGRLVLTETAPGVDPRKDILDQCAFPLRVSDRLAEMDPALFRPEPFGLKLKPS